jgi:hypothetical protein
MTKNEILLVAGVLLALIVGAAVRHYRQTHVPAEVVSEKAAKRPAPKRASASESKK